MSQDYFKVVINKGFTRAETSFKNDNHNKIQKNWEHKMPKLTFNISYKEEHLNNMMYSVDERRLQHFQENTERNFKIQCSI